MRERKLNIFLMIERAAERAEFVAKNLNDKRITLYDFNLASVEGEGHKDI